MTSQLLV